MNSTIWIIIEIVSAVVALAAGFGIGAWYWKNKIEKEQLLQKVEADRILEDAKEKALAVELKARDEALEIHKKAENEALRRRNEVNREEDRVQKRREELDQRLDRLDKREQLLNKRQSAIDKRANEIEKLHSDELEELQRISQLSTEEARAILLQEVEKDTRSDMARIIRQIEMEAREEGETRARKIITTSIQRIASDHVA